MHIKCYNSNEMDSINTILKAEKTAEEIIKEAKKRALSLVDEEKINQEKKLQETILKLKKKKGKLIENQKEELRDIYKKRIESELEKLGNIESESKKKRNEIITLIVKKIYADIGDREN